MLSDEAVTISTTLHWTGPSNTGQQTCLEVFFPVIFSVWTFVRRLSSIVTGWDISVSTLTKHYCATGSHPIYGSYQDCIVNKNMATKDVDSGFSVDFCRVLEAPGSKWLCYTRTKKPDSSVIGLSNGFDVWRHDMITPASASSVTDFTKLRFEVNSYSLLL